MKKSIFLAAVAAIFAFGLGRAQAQLGTLTRDQLIALTPQWQGDRSEDGRPKVSDQQLARLKNVDAEEAWGVLTRNGYINQFEGGWKVINPGPRLVGRVVTAQFMPFRPDVDSVIRANGKTLGRGGSGGPHENSWAIDVLKPGDILVVDLFGKIKDGTFSGDNLGTSIYSKTKTGLIVDGSIRDQTGNEEIHGFEIFVRGVDPSALQNVMLTGLNVPIRIGNATVMPGDVVLTDKEGITFIPPQLVQQVADRAELTHLVDQWGHEMLREGKYTPDAIDSPWTNPMVEEFNKWAASQGSKQRMTQH